MRATIEPGIEELYREHALGLVRFAMLLTGDRTAAEDLVQDAFPGLHRQWGAVRDPDRVLGYQPGGGMLFRWQLKGLRTAESLGWAGGKLISLILDGRYLIDPVTGKATQYRALPLDLYAVIW